MTLILGTNSSCFSFSPLLNVDEVDAVLRAGEGVGVGLIDFVC